MGRVTSADATACTVATENYVAGKKKHTRPAYFTKKTRQVGNQVILSTEVQVTRPAYIICV